MPIFGFCNIALIPIRKEAAHRSEMVTQLLFGEAYQVIEQCGEWAKIKTCFDDYEGYIDFHQLALMHESSYEAFYLQQKPKVVAQTMSIKDEKRNVEFLIAQGSTLPFGKEKTISLGIEKFSVNEFNPVQLDIEQIALQFINAPYLWGGRTIFGIDCSGFVQIIFKILGISLPRDASQQCNCGQEVSNIENIRKGDLAFFVNANNKVVHVGLVLDNSQIIHASGKVRIDKIDEKGIFCIERNEYSHKLFKVKRMI